MTSANAPITLALDQLRSHWIAAKTGTYGGGTRYVNRDSLGGLIDDVRVYNRALSAAQIAAMYAGGK